MLPLVAFSASEIGGQRSPVNDQRTIGEVIRHHGALRPDRPAIVASEHTCLTYRELRDQVDQIRTELRKAGYDRSALIAVAMQNGPRAALAIVAVACSAVAVPVDPNLTIPEIEKRLASLRPNAVLLHQGENLPAPSVAERLGLTIIEAMGAEEGRLSFQIMAPQVGSAALPDDPEPDALAFIFQSSGTTADAKLIPHSHRSMLAVVDRMQTWFELTPQDRCLCAVPTYYGHGLQHTVLTPLLSGGSVAFPIDAARLDLAEWLEALRPTWYSAGPAVHLLVLERSQSWPHARTRHSLRFVVTGGAPLPKEVHEGLETTLGVPVLEHYGGSEFGAVAANRTPPGSSKPGTCGIPWPDVLIIVGDDGRRLPPGQEGEILVKGPTLMSGYLDDPELDRAALVDGWFRTGDIGSLDEEGFLTLCSRRSEIINRGGEKIAPSEIDAALMRHPYVAEAAAYAVAHPRLGESVAAAVVLKAGAAVTGRELRDFLGGQLRWSKIPRRIMIVEELPKGTTGKVLRRRLAEMLK